MNFNIDGYTDDIYLDRKDTYVALYCDLSIRKVEAVLGEGMSMLSHPVCM